MSPRAILASPPRDVLLLPRLRVLADRFRTFSARGVLALYCFFLLPMLCKLVLQCRPFECCFAASPARSDLYLQIPLSIVYFARRTRSATASARVLAADAPSGVSPCFCRTLRGLTTPVFLHKHNVGDPGRPLSSGGCPSGRQPATSTSRRGVCHLGTRE